ncbi:MAG: ABC transporter permease [Thermoanaerobaculia bacterium]|nr:ABC transporter permease [Thermoanaerobaculia bacterium]
MTLDTWLGEVRKALRTFSRSPGYATVVVTTLAVGIAAVTVVLGVFSPYFLRPLPFDDPERVVHLGLVSPETGWDMHRFSAPMVLDLRAQATSFEELGGYYYSVLNLGSPDASSAPERLMTTFVTEDLMPLLGVEAEHGRSLTSGDAGQPVVVVSHRLWQRRWGGDPTLLDREILIDDAPHTVVGIMPPYFSFPFNEVHMWLPLEPLQAGADRDGHGHLLVGRLADGASAESARAELNTIHRRLAIEYPDADGEFSGIVVKDMRAALNFAWDPLRVSFFLLVAAVGALLLLACVNVANLVLARGLARRRELAVRAALGGGRGDLIRPIFVECALLAIFGCAFGLLTARAGLTLLAPLAPDGLFRVGTFGLDGSVLRLSLLVALATPFVFGFLPALRMSQAASSEALRAGGRGGASRGESRGRQALVVVQVTLAVILVAGASLMSRSLVALQQVDLGFSSQNILVAELSPPDSRYADEAAVGQFYDRAVASLEALPGVRAVGATSRLPLNHETFPVWVAPPDTELARESWPAGYVTRVSETYFSAMEVPIIRGRPFQAADLEGDGVLISRQFAQQLWPGEDPLGRTVLWRTSNEPRTSRVLGVVGDVRFADLVGQPEGHLYLPMNPGSRRSRFLVVGTEGPPEARFGGVRSALSGLDPHLPVTLRAMPEVVAESTLQWGISSIFLAVFGALALGLATLGIYGVVAWSVRLRRREIGIRMALGAERARILRWVLGEGLRLAALGCGLGLLAMAALSPVLGSLVYGINALDPVSLVGVALVIAMAALGAATVPARRAAGEAPANVLRDE